MKGTKDSDDGKASYHHDSIVVCWREVVRDGVSDYSLDYGQHAPPHTRVKAEGSEERPHACLGRRRFFCRRIRRSCEFAHPSTCEACFFLHNPPGRKKEKRLISRLTSPKKKQWNLQPKNPAESWGTTTQLSPALALSINNKQLQPRRQYPRQGCNFTYYTQYQY